MPKKQGDRLNVGEVKSSILNFALEKKRPVGEPDIRHFLLKKYDIMDQGNINRHLHNLQKLNCIELIPPKKKGLRNYWDIIELQNLRNIKHEFPEIHLNNYEKSINIILKELELSEHSPDWLNFYLKLLLSISFFNTCVENGRKILGMGMWKIYNDDIRSYEDQSIDDFLKRICFVYIKYSSDSKYSSESKVPEKILEEMNENDYYVKYMLDSIRLRKERKLDFRFLRDDLLLEHFLQHDILIGADSPEETYFVNKTKENHTLPRVSTEPYQIILREAELADLKLASEMIFKFKQPSRFNFDTVDGIYQAILEFYKPCQL